MHHYQVKNVKSIARQVWQEFSPRDGEELACRDDGMIEVTVRGSTEGFDIDPDLPVGFLASGLADRIQTIVMEGRQQMVPDCPLHPAAHPLQSDVVNAAAAWVCPWAKSLVRYMRVVTTESRLVPARRQPGFTESARGAVPGLLLAHSRPTCATPSTSSDRQRMRTELIKVRSYRN